MRFLSSTAIAVALAAVLAGCGAVAVVGAGGTGGSAGGAPGGAAGSTTDPTVGCDLGLADCNGVAADGCEVDLQSDPASCGACGHGCQGGACQTGVCQAVIVATGQDYAYRIAATETALYWTRSDGSVLRAHVGEAPEVIADGQNAPGDIAVNSTHVYWANVGNGTIVRAPLEGTGAEAVQVGLVQPWSLAVSDSMLAWADNMSGQVMAVPLDGGPPAVDVAAPGAWSVTLDATHVYWTSLFNGNVYRAPLDGGEPQALAVDFISPADLALHGDRLFFGTASDAGVFSVPVAGGDTTALTDKGGFGIAVDDTHVYFGEYDGRLARVPLGGGDAEILGIGPATPADVALTSTRVYWTAASSDSVILAVAK